MDREIPVANRYIDKKMVEFRSKKHRETLSQIRKKPLSQFQNSSISPTNHTRYSSNYLENKNLQIQKDNILLFNRIASIIRDKPKVTISKSYAQSFSSANVKHKREQKRLKTQNQTFQRRILQQKSTIKNKLLFKDRQQNLKYLKFIGRFPYENSKKINEDNQGKLTNAHSMRQIGLNQLPTDIEIYRKQTDSFHVSITQISANYYVFAVEVEGQQKQFQYTMNKKTFDDQLSKCGYSYDELIGNLRLNDKNKMVFDYL